MAARDGAVVTPSWSPDVTSVPGRLWLTPEGEPPIGMIEPRGEDWSAFVRGSGGMERLRTYDDREAAAKALCARLGVEMPALPDEADG